jgi:hypothetical protein
MEAEPPAVAPETDADDDFEALLAQAQAEPQSVDDLADFDLADFDDAWESGCAVEVATKARKAELTGVDKKQIATTTKTITLKAEVRVMWNNARSALFTKIMMVFREENGIPPRPKGQQNQSGKKVFKIEDGPWDVVAKKMQCACPATARIAQLLSLFRTGMHALMRAADKRDDRPAAVRNSNTSTAARAQ